MKKIAGMLCPVLCAIFLMSNPIHAAEISSVMNVYTTEDEVVMYVKGQDVLPDQIYVGNENVQEFTTAPTQAVRTIIVVDNSLSTSRQDRASIISFLTDLVAARKDGDTFTIATFSKDLAYLVENSSDYLDIKRKVENLEFFNQETYFTHALYNVLDSLKQAEPMQFTRVIIIADGVDHESLGRTEDEMQEKIKQAKVPIYAIGCVSTDNDESLKKMFALSRQSNGSHYLLGTDSVDDILQGIMSESQVTEVRITPNERFYDGSIQSVRLEYGGDYTSVEVLMPFRAQAPVPEEPIPEPQPVMVEPIVEVEPEPQKEIPYLLYGAIGGGLLALIILICIIRGIVSRKRKKSLDLSGIGQARNGAGGWNGNSETELLTEDGDAGTDMFINSHAVKIILQDMGDSSKIFECPMRGKVAIGKDARRCQVVIDYNKFISSVHCEILKKGTEYYVRDGGDKATGSRNGTYVNGIKATPELPLPSGSVLKLGQMSFKVTYR